MEVEALHAATMTATTTTAAAAMNVKWRTKREQDVSMRCVRMARTDSRCAKALD